LHFIYNEMKDTTYWSNNIQTSSWLKNYVVKVRIDQKGLSSYKVGRLTLLNGK